MTTKPRIYVACLASYNAGVPHGSWIDCEGLDADDLYSEIDKILRSSPHPNVVRRDFTCNVCGHEWTGSSGLPHECNKCLDSDPNNEVTASEPFRSAEEFAIHDHEGFDGLAVEEYTPIIEIAEMVEFLDDHNDNGAVEAAATFCCDIAEIKRAITDRYAGTWDNKEDWAEQYLSDTGALAGLPENLKYYFNYEAFARDCELNGDMTFAEDSSGNVHAFDRC